MKGMNMSHSGHTMDTTTHSGDHMTPDPHSGHGMTGMPTGMPHMGGMKMFFHVGIKEHVLFEQWYIQSVGAMVGSCIAIFILACLYEGLKVLREYLLRKHVVAIRYSAYDMPASTSGSSREAMVMETQQNGSIKTSTDNIVKSDASKLDKNVADSERHKMISWPHILQTMLHILQIVISYFLMLIFMTYNVWLCIAVVLGAGTGYFLFGWKKAVVVDVNEHCH
ncbi:high affinity copper uptake protein 1-like isoform X1 [Tubulanus polymorphus]|uniref:high affinity copper uptake protein 1-like isoform X1 n=1 Tax=Tubulanus polymorphus TaxID=672921 RepID=UPI003DA60B59